MHNCVHRSDIICESHGGSAIVCGPGPELAARAILVRYTGPKLYKWIVDKIETPLVTTCN